jgi:hypothetical protein
MKLLYATSRARLHPHWISSDEETDEEHNQEQDSEEDNEANNFQLLE